MVNHELTRSERKGLYIRLGLRLLIFTALVLVLVFLLPPLFKLFGPFIFAFLMAWVLNPVIRFLNSRLKVPRQLLSMVVIVFFFALLVSLFSWLVYGLVYEFFDLARNWQTIWGSISAALDSLASKSSELGDALPPEMQSFIAKAFDSTLDWFYNSSSSLAQSVLNRASTAAFSFTNVLISIVFFIMASYFITADFPRLRWRLSEVLNPSSKNHFKVYRNAAGSAFIGYIKAQFLLSSMVFIIMLLAFFFWGQEYALLIALVIALIDFFPIFGSGVVLVPWAIVRVVTGNYAEAAFLAILSFSLFMFRRIAEPKVVGTQTGLSPLVSLICIFAGMKFAGVLGMILAPIVYMTLLSIFKSGILDPAIADIKAAILDIRAILRNTQEQRNDEVVITKEDSEEKE